MDAAEGEEDQHEDDQQGSRHNHGQARSGLLQVLELAPEFDGIAGGQLDRLGHAGLGLQHKALHVAPAQVDHDGSPPLGELAGDGADLFLHPEVGHLPELEQSAILRAQGQRLHNLHPLAQVLVQAHHDGESAVAVNQQPDLFPGQGVGDDAVDLLCVQVVTRHGLAPQRDLQHGGLAQGVEFDIGRARYFFQQLAHLPGNALDSRVVLAEDLHRDIGPRAFQDFVEAHLDGLREQIGLAGHAPGELLAHQIGQLILGDSPPVDLPPLFLRREKDVAVGHVDPHGIGGDLRRTDAREGDADLRECLQQNLFGLLLHVQRSIQANAAGADHEGGKRTFVQLRYELRAQLLEDGDRPGEQGDRGHHHQPAHTKGPAQGGRISPLQQGDKPVVFFADFSAEEERTQHGHQGQGQDQRPHQRHHDGQGHGLEHLPFDAGQGQDGQIDDGDDEDPEEGGRAHFLTGVAHRLVALLGGQDPAQLVLAQTEASDGVLHHDHGAVYDQPEVHRAQAHQVAGHPPLHHARDGKQEGERNGQGDDDSGPHIAQQQEEHHHDQHRALHQILLHRGDGAIHQLGAVVAGDDMDPRRKPGRQLLQLGGHPLGDNAAVLTGQHQRRAKHAFLAVPGRSSGTYIGADAHFGHVAHLDGLGPGPELDGQIGDFHRRFHPAGGPDDNLLPAHLHRPATRILHILAHDVRDLGEGDARAHHPLGIGHDHDLFFVAARGVDLGDAGYRAQMRLDEEVLDLTQLHQLLVAGGRLVGGIRQVVHHIVVDIAQPGGDGSQLGGQARRQFIDRVLHALADQLARAVDVGPVLEHQGDLGQPELGERAQFDHARHPGQLHLQREGHQLFDFLGGQRGDLRVDLDLDVGDVGHGIHRQVKGRPHAGGQQGQGGQDDEGSLAQRKLNYFINHRNLLVAVSAALGGAELDEVKGFDRSHDDLITAVQSVRNFREFATPGPRGHRGAKKSFAVKYVNKRAIGGLQQGLTRDHSDRGFFRQHGHGRDKIPNLPHPLALLHLEQHLHAATAGCHGVVHPKHRPRAPRDAHRQARGQAFRFSGIHPGAGIGKTCGLALVLRRLASLAVNLGGQMDLHWSGPLLHLSQRQINGGFGFRAHLHPHPFFERGARALPLAEGRGHHQHQHE